MKMTIQLELTGFYSTQDALRRKEKQRKKERGSKKEKEKRKKGQEDKEKKETKIDGLAGQVHLLLKACGDELIAKRFQRKLLALICKEVSRFSKPLIYTFFSSAK